MKQIDFLLNLFWMWMSNRFADAATWMLKMAQAHYLAGKLGHRFALRTINANIFLVVYSSGKDHQIHVGSMFVDKSVDEAKKNLELQNCKILFFMPVDKLIHDTITASGDEVVYL